MKKKYSTFLNIALGACLITTLVACGNDGDKSTVGPGVAGFQPIVSLTGDVVDTNGNPLEGVDVSCQGRLGITNSLGQYHFDKLEVTSVAGADQRTAQAHTVNCVIGAPDGYTGATVTVALNAQIDDTPSTSGANDIDDTVTNPVVTLIDGMTAQAGTAVLAALESTVTGTLRIDCAGVDPDRDTLAPVENAHVGLDLRSVQFFNGNQSPNLNVAGLSYAAAAPSLTDPTDVTGTFEITGVANDSILNLFVPGFIVNTIDANATFGGTEIGEDGVTITTGNEGEWTELGTVRICPIVSVDNQAPCVRSTEGVVTNQAARAQFIDVVNTVDDGIVVHFNEPMQTGLIDDESVIVNIVGDGYVDVASITMDNSTTMRVKTETQIPEAAVVDLWLDRSNFYDLAGNNLTADDGNCQLVQNEANTTRGNGNWMHLDLMYNMWNVPVVDVVDIDDANQVCPGSDDAGLPDLNEEYPNVFANNDLANANGVFGNLNVNDPMTGVRIEALADELQGGSWLAVIDNNIARVAFTRPTAGDFMGTDCTGFQIGYEDPPNVASPVTSWVFWEDPNNPLNNPDTVDVGDVYCLEQTDDFGTTVNVEFLDPFEDCVAPTPVLNYAYNTCGMLGYDNDAQPNQGPVRARGADLRRGFMTLNAGGVCAVGGAADVPDVGDGGEDSVGGVEGDIGDPSLNITCRLLKDPALIGDANIANVGSAAAQRGIDFFRLYDGDNCGLGETIPFCAVDYNAAMRLYDADEFIAWRLLEFEDTIGVSFSEDIDRVANTTPTLSDSDGDNTAHITGWDHRNNVITTDDANAPDGGVGTTADLALLDFDDIINLANDYDGETINFTDTVVDSNGLPVENAEVVVVDLMPPFVTRAYWDGDLVIEFNEDVADAADYLAGPACNVAVGDNVPVVLNATAATVVGNTMTWDTVVMPDPDTDFVLGDWPEVAYNDISTIVSGTALSHGLLITDCIRDLNGNSWEDYQGAGQNWLDIDGNLLCRTPDFMAVDALGLFAVEQGQTGFVDGTADEFTLIFGSQNHPIDIDATFGCGVSGWDEACAEGRIWIRMQAPGCNAGTWRPISGTAGQMSVATGDTSVTPDDKTFTTTVSLTAPCTVTAGDLIQVVGGAANPADVYVSIYEVTSDSLANYTAQP